MVTASVSLILVIALIALILTGKLSWLGAIVGLLTGASLASLLMPVVGLVGDATQAIASMFQGITG